MKVRKNKANKLSLPVILFVFIFFILGTEVTFAQSAESGNILFQILDIVSNPWDSLAGLIGNLLISLTSTLLALSGSLFDLLIEHTIVKFAGTLTDTGLMTNIEKVWSAFRDIGNIVIIGMFVFVAISIILDLQTYGEKKMIARLLIVAILINFSLFFTKIVIDASHITARQFYTAITKVVSTTEQGTQQIGNSNETNIRSVGISAAFMAKSGIVGGFDTQNFRKRIEQNNGSPFTTILIYSFLVSALIFTVAIILLYGSFLLASRGILLVILMITSSLAFATYLIPSMDGSKYGWKAWRDTLLKTSFMAPLLLLFIWASLFILQSGNAGGNSTIGSFLENPSDASAWQVIWLLIISIGFLFVSIKMSQSLSSGITGFKLSAKVPGLAAVGGALTAGWIGRRTFGAGAGYAQRGAEAIQKRASRSNIPGARMLANRLDNLSVGFGKLQKADFNLANSKLGKELASQAGLKGKLAGTSKVGGYEGIEKARAKTDAGRAKRESLSEDEQKKIIDTAIASAKASGDQNKVDAVGQKEQADRLVSILGKEKEQIHQQYRQEIAQLSQQVAQSAGNPDAERNARDALLAKEKEGQNALKAQDARISNARAESQAALETLLPNMKEINKLGKRGAADRAAEISEQRPFNVASRVASKIPFVEGGKRSAREAAAARKQVGESKKDEDEKRLLSKLREQIKEGDEDKKDDSGGKGDSESK